MAAGSATLAARTDQTKLCRSCVARFGGIVCPACGDASPFDLSRAAERKRANDWIAALQPGSAMNPFIGSGGRGSWLVPAGLLAVAVVWTIIALRSGFWIAWALAVAFGWMFIARVMFGTVVPRVPREKLPKAVASFQVIGVLPPELPPASADRILRKGSVHCEELLVAPLSGTPCVAFRLVGRVGDCLVDDGAAASFTLVPRDGPAVTVLSSASLLELPVRGAPAQAGALDRVRSFLAGRGVDASKDPVELAEGILANGEEVEVEGTLESVASGAGYRGTAHSELVVGRTDAPVIVRRA